MQSHKAVWQMLKKASVLGVTKAKELVNKADKKITDAANKVSDKMDKKSE